MRTALLMVVAAGAAFAQSHAAKELDAVARVATVMLDGDLCRRIQTPRSEQYMTKKDPRDPWIDADNFDVDLQTFTRVKKTLIRLARLCPQSCDVNLWMPLKSDANRVQILIRNVNELSQFWTWGALSQETPAEMKRVLASGERVIVSRNPGVTSVLAPVYDSLGDIAGLVEVVSRDQGDPQENVK